MIKGTAFFCRVILSSSLMVQAEEGGRSWQDHTLTKKGKLQQSRDLNKVNWGVPSTNRKHNRQTRYWCDFNQKEKKIMRKEQMIKKPKSLVKWQKFSSAFYNRSSNAHNKCLEIEIGFFIRMVDGRMGEGGGCEHCASL